MPSVVVWPVVGWVASARLRAVRPEARLPASSTPPVTANKLPLFPLSALKVTLPLKEAVPPERRNPRLALALFSARVDPPSHPPVTASRVLPPELTVVAPE